MIGPHWPCAVVVGVITVALVALWMFLVVPWIGSTGLTYASYGIGPLALVALMCTSCCNPGLQLQSCEPREARGWKNLRLCVKCDILQEPSTRHCNDCGVCVRGHDHHCPVMGQCIGGANLMWFRLFVTCSIVFPCLLLASVIAGLVINL
eukprot:TRINITY_DN41502_c0_g1_i1.p1 TRINITY_DN41502_c0_g1~~TRINITY_DN41502_c0_g1_i1.p1  ORF type:complete len:150 (-),score=19.52 TRINITY_DN41502_c0_g1_i1:35-484(-)